MAMRQALPKSKVSMPVVVVAVSALVALTVWWGFHTLGSQDRGKSQQELTTDQRISKLAAQSGGDPTKLGADDQKWLNNITMGHAAQALTSAKKQ